MRLPVPTLVVLAGLALAGRAGIVAQTPLPPATRAGFDAIPAVRDGFLREIKSPLILQPGPAALTDGLDALCAIVAEWAQANVQGDRRVIASPR